MSRPKQVPYFADRVVLASRVLTPIQKLLWVTLRQLDQGPEGAFIGGPALAERLGLSLEAVEENRRRLVALGLLVSARASGRRGSCWFPTLPTDCLPSCAKAKPEEVRRLTAMLDACFARLTSGVRGHASPGGAPNRSGVPGHASTAATVRRAETRVTEPQQATEAGGGTPQSGSEACRDTPACSREVSRREFSPSSSGSTEPSHLVDSSEAGAGSRPQEEAGARVIACIPDWRAELVRNGAVPPSREEPVAVAAGGAS